MIFCSSELDHNESFWMEDDIKINTRKYLALVGRRDFILVTIETDLIVMQKGDVELLDRGRLKIASP